MGRERVAAVVDPHAVSPTRSRRTALVGGHQFVVRLIKDEAKALQFVHRQELLVPCRPLTPRAAAGSGWPYRGDAHGIESTKQFGVCDLSNAHRAEEGHEVAVTDG